MRKDSTGERIYMLRRKMRMTQKVFGQAMEIWPQNISAWERGKRAPGIEACAKIINFAQSKGIAIDFNYLRPDLTQSHLLPHK